MPGTQRERLRRNPRARARRTQRWPICPKCKVIWGDHYPSDQVRFRCPTCLITFTWDKTPREEKYDQAAWDLRAWDLISWEPRHRRAPPRFRLVPHRTEDLFLRAFELPAGHVYRVLVCSKCDHLILRGMPKEQSLFHCSICDTFYLSPYVSDRQDEKTLAAAERRMNERRAAGRCPYWNEHGEEAERLSNPPPSEPGRS